jgi:hypothetical protein
MKYQLLHRCNNAHRAGFIDVRVMCGNVKGFNVARGIKHFISADRAIDKDFYLLPLGGQDNNLCIPADLPKLKKGIQKWVGVIFILSVVSEMWFKVLKFSDALVKMINEVLMCIHIIKCYAREQPF